MFTENEAKEKILEFLRPYDNKGHPLEVTFCTLSDRQDYWILNVNTKEPFPKLGGMYGFLLNNNSGEIMVCGVHDGPHAYIQDGYDLEEANGKSYVLICKVQENNKGILLLKKAFGVDYKKAIQLIRSEQAWFVGKKRHLQCVQQSLRNIDVATKLELRSNENALVKIERDFYKFDQLITSLCRKS